MKKIGRKAVLPIVSVVRVSGQFHRMAKTRAAAMVAAQRPPSIARWLPVRTVETSDIMVGQTPEGFARDEFAYRVRAIWQMVFIGRRKARE